MNIEVVKEKLLGEKVRLEEELKGFKSEDPYLAQNRDLEINSIDNDSIENESHDRIEAIRNSLKRDLSEIILALEKLERGAYGQCEAGEHPIEEDRLLASPTAQYCVKHAH